MRLTKCYVSSFGVLKNYTYEFTVGLNTIKEDNGWGKSTLAAFIKAMFYGLNDTKRSVSENERIKYRPWNSTERFGGYVEFERNGGLFRIERFFGTKSSDDTVKLIDLNTGRAYTDTENWGKRTFEIDEEGFLSTTYFSQKDFQIKSNTSITAKFNSVCEIQDSEAFDKAISKIQDKAKTYKYTGNRGLIADAKRELFDINAQLEQSIISAKAASDLNKSVAILEDEVLVLAKKSNELTEKVALAGREEAVSVRKRQFEELVLKKERLEKNKTELEKKLGGLCPGEKELKAYFDCNTDLINVSAKVDATKADVESFSKEVGFVGEENKNKNALLLCVLSIIAIILGSVMLAFSLPVAITLFVIAAILIVFACCVWVLEKNKKTATNDRLNQLLSAKQRELAEYENIKNEYQIRLEAFINRFNLLGKFDRTEALSLISKTVEEYSRIKNELNSIETELKAFESEKDEFFNARHSNLDIHELKRELYSVQDQYKRKANELASKQSSARSHVEIADTYQDLEAKKADVNEKLQRYTDEYQLLLKTAEYLKLADENLKIRYRTPLQESLNKYLRYITGGYKSAQIDIDLNVTILENGEEKSTEFYSKGFQNLFEICKRFALTDVLFTKEKPFIILDDPFYNFDDKKLSAAVELLKKLAGEYQIIYLVCHQSRSADNA